MPHAPFRPRALGGFTLIELLTVIAIIGILAAILIPTVGKVRFKAREAAKASNYRQIWIANTLYANDNNGFTCPTEYYGPDGRVYEWRRALAPYISANGRTDIDFRMLPVFIDPLYAEHDPSIAFATRTGIGMNDTLNTPVNVRRNNPTANEPNRLLKRLEQVTFPERRMFICDSVRAGFLFFGNFDFAIPTTTDPERLPRHNGKSMMVRFSGQVVLVTYEEALAAALDPSVPFVGN